MRWSWEACASRVKARCTHPAPPRIRGGMKRVSPLILGGAGGGARRDDKLPLPLALRTFITPRSHSAPQPHVFCGNRPASVSTINRMPRPALTHCLTHQLPEDRASPLGLVCPDCKVQLQTAPPRGRALGFWESQPAAFTLSREPCFVYTLVWDRFRIRSLHTTTGF